MAKFELKEGGGSLFKNDRKEKPTHPDYKGEIKINGVSYWLSAWIKEGKNGKFMSLSAKPKEERVPGGVKYNPGIIDEDIPF